MKAELKHIAPYLAYDLEGKDFENQVYLLGPITQEHLLTNEKALNPLRFLNECKPIMHPLSNLIKEIEFEGEKFRPMFKLLQLVSKQQEILSETIEYSYDPEQKSYFIRVNYKGFFVILAFDTRDKSFTMIRNGKLFSINNQLEAFEWLYKRHFNIYEVESIDK